MLEKSTSIGFFDSHVQAEAAVNELRRSGFDMRKLSIVGKANHTEELVVGYHHT